MKAIPSIALSLLVWFLAGAPESSSIELRRDATSTVDLVWSSHPQSRPGPSHGDATPAILLHDKGENAGKKPQYGILTASFQISAPLPRTAAHALREVVADVSSTLKATPLRC